MQKRLIVAVTLLLVIVAGLIAYQALREREPVYAGKSLRAWLRDYDQANAQGVEAYGAIRQIGTNAIPTLLKMLCETNSVFRSKLSFLWERGVRKLDNLPTWVRSPGWYRNQASAQNRLAEVGFRILRDDARHAVPALMQIYERNPSLDSQRAASLALISIGPAGRVAIPLFSQGALSPNLGVRRIAVAALAEVRAEPQLVVPALVKSLSDPNPIIRFIAVQGLQQFGSDAQQAFPALLPLFTDSNSVVRLRAADALKAIDPEAAAKAGVK